MPPAIDAFEPDAERLATPVTRAELFSLCSALFRICTFQQMALQSLRNPDIDVFDAEIADADKVLEELYGELNQIVGTKSK